VQELLLTTSVDVAAMTKLIRRVWLAKSIKGLDTAESRGKRQPLRTAREANHHHPSQFTIPSPHDTLTRQFKPFLFPFCNNTFAAFSIYSILFFVYKFATEDPAKLAWRTSAFFLASALARSHITYSWRENR